VGNHKIVVDGVTKDLQDDYSVSVETSQGMGIPPTNNLNTELALQPGALIEGQTYQARVMTWNCHIEGTSQADFHDKRQAFIKALDTQAGKIDERPTGIEVQYTGATVDKKINVVYDGGLEGNNWNQSFQERFSLRLRADDPMFDSTAADTTTALDSEDSATFTTAAKREGDASVPIYNTMSAPASGITAGISEILVDDTYAYYGGTFTNYDGIANADYIARWNILTEAWSALGTGADDSVFAMALAPNGDLYVAGSFTNIGGASFSSFAGVAYWDGSAWNEVGNGTGANADIFALEFDNAGNLYVGGSFTTMDASSYAAIIKWDGSAWSALGTGCNNTVYTIAHSNGIIYAGGTFTTAGGTTVNRLAQWDGSTWATLGTGTGANAQVTKMEIATDGTIYIAGQFVTVDGVTVNRVAQWNGSSWRAMGTGFDDVAYRLHVAPDGIVYVGGDFTTADGETMRQLAKWNGSSWFSGDFNVSGGFTGLTPFVDSNDNLWLGFENAGASTFSGDTTIAYAGTAKSYPQITINRDGGTSAKLIQLRNETTGATLFFDYDLLDGETLTLEFDQRAGAFMTSSIRGNVYSELLPNSNFGTFYLTPGNGTGSNDNVITLFVDNDGATVTSNIIYTIRYISAD